MKRSTSLATCTYTFYCLDFIFTILIFTKFFLISTLTIPYSAAPDDYFAHSSTWSFTASQSIQCVIISTNPDNLVELDEVFPLVLTNPDPSGQAELTLSPNTTILTIINDDGMCSTQHRHIILVKHETVRRDNPFYFHV